jgi:hypothetical protein
MDLSLLATLKDKLATASDFSEVQRYFLDHFGEDPEFMKLGEKARHPFLEAVFAQIGQQLFRSPAALMELLLIRLPEHHFIHGSCVLNGRLSQVIYFEDVQLGLLTVLASLTPPETKYARFSGRAMPRGWSPSTN